MALDDVGANPRRLANAIHEQLDDPPGPLPVHDIALALDISEVREEWLTNLEGALITMPERDKGKILVNRASIPQRRRFTLAHELGHFLNPWHQPTTATGFECTRSDMAAGDLQSRDCHRRQEAEANSFAIELLTPRKHLSQHLEGDADLRGVVAIAAAFGISREAAARRYVSLHPDTTAVVFSRNGFFYYAELSTEFPVLCLRRGMALPITIADPLRPGFPNMRMRHEPTGSVQRRSGNSRSSNSDNARAPRSRCFASSAPKTMMRFSRTSPIGSALGPIAPKPHVADSPANLPFA